METDYTSRQFASGPAFNANEQANILSGNEHLNRPENQVGFRDPTKAYGYVAPDYASRITARPADAPQPVNEDEIRKRKTDEAQAIVNSINAQFAPLFSQQEDFNKGQEARTRALNISSGLAGSDFASSAATETEAKGKRANELLVNERAAKIAEVLSKVSSQTDEAIAAKRKAFNEDTTAYNTRRKEAVDEVKNNVTSLATSGVSIAKLKSSEPAVYKRLMEDGGFKSELEFDSFFETQKPKAQQIDWKEVYAPGANGTTKVTRYGFNPATGQPETKEYSLPVPYSSVASQENRVIDGVLYGKQTDGTWKALTPPKRVTPTGTERTRALTTKAISMARPELEGSRKGGEFVDGNIYNKLRTDYAEAIGDVRDFDNTFAALLSPQDRAKYGVGKATGLKAVDTPEESPDLFNEAKSFIQQMKDSGISKGDAEDAIADADPADKAFYEQALDEIY